MKLRSSLLAILMPTLASADEVLLNWREDTGAWVGKRLTTVPGHYLSFDANGVPTIVPYTGATGDVVGPASATTGAFPTFSGTTGKVIANSIYTPAYVLSRANHSGSQAVNTITGLAPVATSGSATDLSAGSLADARLSANIPRLASANTFTADTQTIATANLPALVVNSTGGGGTNKAAAFAAGSGAGIISFDNSGDFGIGSNTKANVTTTPGSGGETWRMWIKGATGNVGIGTTAPSEKLHVVGSAQFDAASPYINLKSSAGGNYYIQSNSTTLGYNGGNYLAYLVPAGKGHAWIESTNTRMIIEPTTGNVGIGTTSPTSKLDVAETWNGPVINVTGASGTGSFATITFATQAAAIPVGTTVVIASVNPSGYNGTAVVTASSVTSVSYANATTATYVSGGTVQRQFTAIKANVTDTASDPTSKLLDLQVGGVSKFSINKAGDLTMNSAADPGTYISNPYLGFLFFGGNARSFFLGQDGGGNGLANMSSFGSIGFSSAAIPAYNTSDVRLWRDGAGQLALRNGANAQTFRVYNTYSNAGVDVEYLQLSTSVNGFRVGTNSSGSGTPRPLFLGVGGGSQWQINTAGHIGTFGSDNLYDIGASGANRPRNVYVGNSLTTGSIAPNSGTDLIFNGASTGAAWKITPSGHFHAFVDNAYDIGANGASRPRDIHVGRYLMLGSTGAIGFSSRSYFRSPSDGVMTLVNTPETDFNRLQFGGTTASFPAIKRVGAEFQIVKADTAAASNVAAADADMTFIEDRFRRKGTGTPEAAVTAPIGAVYHRTDGGAGTSFYVKESGTGNTGWVAK